ncbi:2-hydroxyacylsphingosine 1-beta-galactosyltransferase [Penaeus vannamei]|uniref:2-hydroxyacylsphingosine 1-beta-galactosyltransferase n=1 Tax=Penaeus vannamei TaxID=6689 RepID=A0A423TBE9_PENVA|nr:2-hydroxyacylsphingosine 1-beta-galactosyltransferase [Penaeus vannamei]
MHWADPSSPLCLQSPRSSYCTNKMRVALMVLLVALVGVSLGKLAPLEKPYKILMLLPAGSRSHKVFFMSVADALAERGHKVVMLSGYPASSKNPNVLEINHGLKEFDVKNMNLFDFRNDPTGGFSILVDILPAMAKKLYKIPQVMDLYHKRKTFDLIIVDQLMNEMIYPFVHELTYMTIAAFGMDACHSAVLGNVQNPAYVSGMLEEYPSPLSLKHRFLNLMQHILMPFYCWRHWSVVPKIQKERNQSLTLINSHFSIDVAVPLLPSQVAVGAIHCRPANPFRRWELEAWISGAGPEGVVYFSLGTVASRSPQRKCLVFITTEVFSAPKSPLYHATPVVALPIFADQPKNAMTIQKRGVGVVLVWEELYKRNAEQVRNTVRDTAGHTKERAVYWTEYVVRHQGAPALRSPAAKLSWVEFLLLDVLLVLHVVVYVAFCVLSRVVRAVKGRLFPGSSKKKRD